jgi:hypothetical protein
LPLTHATALKPLATSEVAQMEKNSDEVEKQREKQRVSLLVLYLIAFDHDRIDDHS